jgi:hypothetical protein
MQTAAEAGHVRAHATAQLVDIGLERGEAVAALRQILLPELLEEEVGFSGVVGHVEV